ncbi:type I-E CRISPR-associated protein Cse1/CasA [Nocardia wallacei]|uniref:type I-E CRISPR-associated protein Cse1/CasA n=1 Tax=Nocardia wallacei TaxID=480035 RepID=UPI0024559CC5|nr:type I-E CRISPR-associated protein Cse1/CasA [Nocardia wallacei]
MTSPPDYFDLTERPWITATPLGEQSTLDPQPVLVSLRDVFAQAHALSALTGDVPTQAFAILRLLLAILRRSLADRPGTAAQTWEELWRAEQMPMEQIGDYLTRHQARFRLFDAQAPFFQVAGLRSATGAVSGLDRLIADVPNGEKYFTTRAGAGVEEIDYAEAARWLVHAHAFDPSGIKTGALGDDRVKNNKGYPIGVAWTGNLGGVFVEGATLRETLLLNLVLLDTNSARYSRDDKPVWERDPDTAAEREDTRPAGPADLCTWQSRRIRLVHNGSRVTGVVLCNGDALEPFNKQLIEPMTGWRYSETQSKKAGGQPRHYPMLHDPAKALWRGFAALLGEVANPSSTTRRAIAPGVMEWTRYLMDQDVLEPTHPVRLHATGMQYINNQSVIGDLFDDTIGFRAGLLSDPVLRTCAVNAVKVGEDCVHALTGLAGNLAAAAGGDTDGARARARENGYFALNSPYRRWLAALTPGGGRPVIEYDRVWQCTVRAVIEPLGDNLVAQAGIPAWVGREVGGRYLDASVARKWFHERLHELVPSAYPRPDSEGESAA